jgi:hypothetical protein
VTQIVVHQAVRAAFHLTCLVADRERTSVDQDQLPPPDRRHDRRLCVERITHGTSLPGHGRL